MAEAAVGTVARGAARSLAFAAAAAALVALLIYLPTLSSAFVNWDDEDYLRDNLYLRAINGRFFVWAFTEFHAANWYPLSWLSHAIDFAVWGPDPFGHHLANLVLHAVNCALVVGLVHRWRVGDQSASREPLGGIVAALSAGVAFALHPIHVEAVSWISQRKELLCSLFYLIGLLAYLGPAHRARSSAATCGVAFVSHALALMAKPMAVSFPLVLCLLDIRPLRRWTSPKQAALVLLEKLPFFGLSLGVALLTLRAQGGGGALATMDELALGDRVYTAALALVDYGADLVVPTGLAPLYPYPVVPAMDSVAYFAPFVAVAGVTASVLLLARRCPGLAVAAAALLVTLLPVLGLVQVGGQARADRYLYLPGVAVFALFGVAAAWGLRRAPAIAGPVLVLVLTAWGGLTLTQQGAWRDGVSLWSRQIEVFPSYGPGYAYRGHALGRIGAFEAAQRDFERARTLPPPSPEPLYYLGEMRLLQGRALEAATLLRDAIGISAWPDARFHVDLGRAYGQLGEPQAALDAVAHALSMEPGAPLPRVLRACALAELGDTSGAAAELQRVCAALPAVPPSLEHLSAEISAAAAGPEPRGRIAAACAARYRGDPM